MADAHFLKFCAVFFQGVLESPRGSEQQYAEPADSGMQAKGDPTVVRPDPRPDETTAGPSCVRRVIGTTFVFRWKVPNVEKDSSDSPPPEPKAKVRGCAQDFNFFKKTVDHLYAPTGKDLTFRLFMNTALHLDLFVHHIDVKTAFLYALLEEEVWVWPFPGEPAPPGYIHRHACTKIK